jgi:hypothetical protein
LIFDNGGKQCFQQMVLGHHVRYPPTKKNAVGAYPHTICTN